MRDDQAEHELSIKKKISLAYNIGQRFELRVRCAVLGLAENRPDRARVKGPLPEVTVEETHATVVADEF